MRRKSTRFGTVVLTGATGGIGRETALRIAPRCGRLIIHGPEAPAAVGGLLAELNAVARGPVEYLSADFTRLDDVVALAASVRALVAGSRVDLLVNNAGIPGAPRRALTRDGFERTLQVNALAPALLTRLLMPSLAGGGRIVNVGSSAHRVEHFDWDDLALERDYTPVAAYARAKLTMIAWSRLLAGEIAPGGPTVIALCPGLNDTPLSSAMMGRIGGPATEGAARVLHAAEADVPSGSYLEGGRVVEPSADALDSRNQERLVETFWSTLRPYAQSA
jgi:NAD(P)-dependent dehydrogenase (short-subunit alcohol dehydrogenase family)